MRPEAAGAGAQRVPAEEVAEVLPGVPAAGAVEVSPARPAAEALHGLPAAEEVARAPLAARAG